jgi:hypothetical protein
MTKKYTATLMVTRVTTYEVDLEAESDEDAAAQAEALEPWDMTEIDDETVDMNVAVKPWRILG